MMRTALAAALLVAFTTPALADIWRVAPDESAIRFEYVEDGEPKSGRFLRFSGRGVFDPDYPDRAQLVLEIQMDSVQLEDAFRTDFVRGPVWFGADAHPIARYELEQLTAQGADAYFAVGRLTLKGRSQTLTTPLTIRFDEGPGRARALGRLSFDRYDFAIGDDGLLVDIGRQITVDFNIVATGR